MTRSASTFMLPTAPARTVPPLGVGLTYQPKMRGFIDTHWTSFDYLEVVPDMLWEDRGDNAVPRYVDDEDARDWLRGMRSRMPVVAHSIGWSVGSAHRAGRQHIKQLARWHRDIGFAWHSDHLAFNLSSTDSGQINVGITLPVAQDQASVNLIAARVDQMHAAIDLPFAFENNVYFFEYHDQEYDDADFLNRVADASDCSIVLDLHNLYTNARNHGQTIQTFLDQLDSSRVIEIHVAGGMEVDGYYLDAHSGPTPPEVLDLLRLVLPRCPNVGGVTFEILGSWYEHCGERVLLDELSVLRQIWTECGPRAVEATS